MRYSAPPVSSASIAAALSGADLSLGAAQAVVWSGRSQIGSGADGTLSLRNNAGTGFTLLQFGGTTSSFPAIKRNATTVAFRLADDSSDAHVTMFSYALAARTMSGLGAASGAGQGAVAYVIDLVSTTRGATATGGGALKGFVWSDGTNWLVF